MTIEITSPDVEALIRDRMRVGSFKTAEDLIRDMLEASQSDTRTGATLIDAMRACPDPDVDLEPARILSPVVRGISF